MSKKEEKETKMSSYSWIDRASNSVLMGVANKMALYHPNDLVALGFEEQALLEANEQTLLKVLKTLLINWVENNEKAKSERVAKKEEAQKRYALDGDEKKLRDALTKVDQERQAVGSRNMQLHMLSDALVAWAESAIKQINCFGFSEFKTTEEGPVIVINKGSVRRVDSAKITLVYVQDAFLRFDKELDQLRDDYKKLQGYTTGGTAGV